MVSKKLLKSYDFENIECYFDYIVESYINGQLMQVVELCKKLAIGQKIPALRYIQDNYSQNNIDEVNYITEKLF